MSLSCIEQSEEYRGCGTGRYADTRGLAELDTAGLSLAARTPYRNIDLHPCRNMLRRSWPPPGSFVMGREAFSSTVASMQSLYICTVGCQLMGCAST